AEDGIRDRTVTGVQTCALPILTIAHGPGWPVASVNLPNGFALGATTGYLAVRPISQGQSACAHGLRPHRWLRHRCNSCWPSRKEIGRASCRERVWIQSGYVVSG